MDEGSKAIERAIEIILTAAPDEVRHPIVADYNDDVAALATSLVAITETLGIMGLMSCIRVYCETLFVLGYRAGQKSTQDDLSLWENALDG